MAHPIVPVIIVGEAAQAGLHPADENRHILVGLPDAVAVDHRGPVGAHAGLAAGGIGVLLAALFRHGVMVDHAVNDPGGHQEAQARTSKTPEGALVLPGRKAQHGHPIACLLQNPADDGMPEGGMIHIRVTADEDKVRRVPAKGVHFLRGNGQKAVVHADASHQCLRPL